MVQQNYFQRAVSSKTVLSVYIDSNREISFFVFILIENYKMKKCIKGRLSIRAYFLFLNINLHRNIGR